MKEYTASKGRGRLTVDTHEAYAVLEEKIDILRAMLHKFDYSGFLTGGHNTLAKTANHVLGIKDGKKRFWDTALAMSKAFTLCCTLDEAKAVREEAAFFQAVKVLLTKKEISSKRKPMMNVISRYARSSARRWCPKKSWIFSTPWAWINRISVFWTKTF